MSNSDVGGSLVFSIDLELDIEHRVPGDERRLDALSNRLIQLFQRHQAPATWAVADPARSMATDAILAARAPHEIAVLGDRTWIGAAAGRSRSARELARRFDGAREAGIDVSTLALRQTNVGEHHDLLVRHQISTVRCAPNASGGGAVRPEMLRFSVWQMPVSLRMPIKSRWFGAAASSLTVRHLIQQAIATSRVAHLAIDAPQMLVAENATLQVVERALRFAQRLRDAGSLEITTLREQVRRTAQPRQSAPAHSILRAA